MHLKGVSTFLAMTLLIIATVSLAIIVSSWYSSTTIDQTKIIGNKTEQSVDCTFVSTDIQDVYLDLSNNRGRASVVNTGQKDDTLVSAKFLTTSGEEASIITTLPASLNKGSSLSVEFNTQNIITTCSNFSKVIVASKCTSKEFVGTPKGC